MGLDTQAFGRDPAAGQTRPQGFDSRRGMRRNADRALREASAVAAGAMPSLASLERNLKFTQFAVDHAAEGIAWITRDGRFQYVNDELCRLLGYSRPELLAMRTLDIDRSLTEESWETHWRHVADVGSYVLQTVHRTKDGREIPVEVAINVEDQDGEPYHCVFVRDLTEHKRAEAELRQTAERLQEAYRHLAVVVEQERRRLAADLHDNVGSNLAALALGLEAIRDALPQGDEMLSRLEDEVAILQDTVASVRNITSDLRPMMLEHGDLLTALEEYCRQYAARSELAIAVDGSSVSLAHEEKIALFRIAQEALHNCVKHARARSVHVELGGGLEHPRLVIADDGIGFDAARSGAPGQTKGLGLLSMRERAEAIGWTFRLESGVGQGTRITVEKPAPVSRHG